MKILTAEQIRQADTYTIKHEPVASIDLMERAAKAFCDWFEVKFSSYHPVSIFCGTGNNGGDGLAIARMLIEREFSVNIYVLRGGNESGDFKANETRLGPPIMDIKNDLPDVLFGEIIIDALYGTGLSRPLEGKAVQLVEHLNKSKATRVSVDIPSGLYADKLSNSTIFKAHYTFTFQVLKLAFLLPLNDDVVGEWQVGDIGLHAGFIAGEPTNNHYLTAADIHLKKRPRFSHKGTYGHALMVAGSYGKIGAAILSTHACLCSGAGLVTLYTAECGYTAVQSSVPEAMLMCSNEKLIADAIDTEKYNTIGIGPGIGTEQATAVALYQFITHAKHPMVLDADALNILAKFPEWLKDLPKGSILTPHPKEFERLFGETKDPFEKLELLRHKSVQYQLHIVLKGSSTAIASPDGEVWFNSTGNPGMATGGTGDVLTGIVTGLLAQGYQPKEAAHYGVYLHGLAGDFAAKEMGMEALLAGDVVRQLGNAFNSLRT